MNRTWLLVVVFASATAARAHDERHDEHHEHDGAHDGPTCDASVLASFARLDDAMRQMDADVDQTRSRRERARLESDMARVRQGMQQARVDACRAARPDVVVVAPPPPPAVRVMDASGERALVNAVRREAFDDARLTVLGLGTQDVCVTSAQAKDLVEELSFSRPRLEALRLLAARIVDKDASYQLLEAMTFESDKRDAREILSSTPTARECRVEPRRL